MIRFPGSTLLNVNTVIALRTVAVI